MKRKHPESQILIALYKWYKLQHREHLDCYERHDVGGWRTKAEASILKAEGQQKGTSDLFIALPRGEFCGLYLEVKTGKTPTTKRGTPTQEQTAFGFNKLKRGYCFKFGFGFDQCRDIINEYMKKPHHRECEGPKLVSNGGY